MTTIAVMGDLTVVEIAREWLRRAIAAEGQRVVSRRLGISDSGVSVMKRPEEEQEPGDRRTVAMHHLDAYARSFDPPKRLGDVLQQLTDIAKEMEWERAHAAPVAVETEIKGARVVLAADLARAAGKQAADRKAATTRPTAADTAPPRQRRNR